MVISDALPSNLQFTSESSEVKAQLEKQGYSGLERNESDDADEVAISSEGDALALALQESLGAISSAESSTALLGTLGGGSNSDLLTAATFSESNATLFSNASSGNDTSSSLLNLLG